MVLKAISALCSAEDSPSKEPAIKNGAQSAVLKLVS
jgi:hypothetical protein